MKVNCELLKDYMSVKSVGKTDFYMARVLGVRREGELDRSLRIALMGDIFVETKQGSIWSVVYDFSDDSELIYSFVLALTGQNVEKPRGESLQFRDSGDMVSPSAWNKPIGVIVETDYSDRSKIVGYFPIGAFWSAPHAPHLPELKWAE